MSRIHQPFNTRSPLAPVNIRLSPRGLLAVIGVIGRAIAFNTTLPGRYRGVA